MDLNKELMLRFAEETSLENRSKSSRYLWTDAFAVCNFLTIGKVNLAKILVNEVHNILGKYREDDKRSGWIGTEHRPTLSGLRIGKPLPERRSDQTYDPNLEWDRDGQYFHYLTKWIHALNQIANVTQEEIYFNLAIDLAIASTRFLNNGNMHWKMSTDLSYPLVNSMGQHDPIDGYVTFKVLHFFTDDKKIEDPIKKLSELVHRVEFRTTDPLGIGGLLFDAYRLYQLNEDPLLIEEIMRGCIWGLRSLKLAHKLAFRELGLAIGLKAAEEMNKLDEFIPLRENIINYWIKQTNFEEHRDINSVMLATALNPSKFLSIV